MKKLLPILILLFLSLTAIGQTFTYTFIDPCTKEMTQFNLPIQSGNGTLVSFLGQQKYFTADDVISGVFASWINQVYSDYRRLTPCSIQTTTIIRNQITSQIIGSTIQSVVGTIMGQVNLESGMLVNGDLSSNTDKDNKKTKNNGKSVTNNNNNSGNSSNNNGSNVNTQNVSGSKPAFATSPNPTISPTNVISEKQQPITSSVGTNSNRNGGTTENNSTSTSSSTNTSVKPSVSTTKTNNKVNTNTNVQTNGKNISTNKGVNNSVSTKTQGNSGPSVKNSSTNTETTNTSTTSNSTNTQETTKSEGGGQTGGQGSETGGQGSEVAVTTTMTTDANNDKGNGSKGGGKGKTNPIIISSDLTSAQNMDRSFTPIINVGMSQSSMTGTSSWGLNSMIWLNFKQFALTGRYTKMHFSKNKKLKLIHNLNLTGVYSYGNLMSFLGYSMILNAGKYGITGFNVSGSITKSPEDVNLYLSPAMTAFYTKPFKVGKRMILSPELYVISTPLMYSSVDKVSVSDRTFSAFIGTSIDYQFTKRFKVNMNYKLNTSTNPDFPVLSFFLIGSKINL
jgi:hypothetical protein